MCGRAELDARPQANAKEPLTPQEPRHLDPAGWRKLGPRSARGGRPGGRALSAHQGPRPGLPTQALSAHSPRPGCLTLSRGAVWHSAPCETVW